MNEYIVYWLDGKREKMKGDTIANAFRNAGYGGGASSAIDWYDEATEFTHEWVNGSWKRIEGK